MNKTYTNSKGETLDISTMNSEHVFNALSKKIREVFNATSKDEAFKTVEEVNVLKEETFKRINDFIESLGETDGRK